MHKLLPQEYEPPPPPRPGLASWALALIITGMYASSSWPKFAASERCTWVFDQLGIEPWGRIFVGMAEVVAAMLVVIPSTRAVGAVASIGVMGSALMTHLFVIGIVVNGDRGAMFAMAVGTAVASVVLLWIERGRLPLIGPLIGPENPDDD